jgi:O-antigen ligase
VIGLGLPLFFNIKDKGIRNIGLTICIMTLFIRARWIGLACLVIMALVIPIKKKWVLFLLPICLVFGGFAYYQMYSTPCGKAQFFPEKQIRLEYYKYAWSKWEHKWTGEGLRSWSKLPENQPDAVSPIKEKGKWLHTLHSDVLQLFFEFGIIGGVIVGALFMFPLFWLKMNTLLRRTLMASYLCLIMQACIDFPFHRMITGMLGLLIMLLIYREILSENRSSAN